MRQFSDARKVCGFLALAFGFSWVCWGAALWLVDATADSALRIVGTFGPSGAAVVLIARCGGGAAVSSAVRCIFRLRGNARPIAIAAATPPVLCGLGVVVDRWLGGGGPIDWPPWWALLIVLGYVAVLGGPLGEELGWRGYLLPTLEIRVGTVWATIVVGLVWWLWHFPLFFLAGTVQAVVPQWIFFWQIMVTSIFYTLLVHRTPGSLAAPVVFHTSFNSSVGILLLGESTAAQPQVRPLVVALLAATAVALSGVVLLRRTDARWVAPSAWWRVAG
jgi:membrane protease YdiL (CAAX protease family)